MIFTPLQIQDVYRIDLERREDSRGFFARLFCAEEFEGHGLATTWAQCNTSLTRERGTVRGMHFQRPPRAEAKLIRCIRGAVLDVAVDLRQGSPTYGRWISMEISADNRSMIYIPPGFAHGFQTLELDCELLYFHSQYYSPVDEGGLNPLTPEIASAWQLPVAGLSPRDMALPSLSHLEPIAL